MTNSIHPAYIHTSARASTRSLTYDECTKACMYENTHKSIISARWNNKQHSFNIEIHTHLEAHNMSRGSVCMFVYQFICCQDGIIRARWNNKQHSFSKHTHICSCKHTLAHVCTKACMYENTLKSIIRARWNNKQHSFNIETHTHLEAHNMSSGSVCMFVDQFNFCQKGIIRARWNDNSIHPANIHTSARARTCSLTYDECTKACMYENTHKSIIRARCNNKQHSFNIEPHTHLEAHNMSRRSVCMFVYQFNCCQDGIIRARWNNKQHSFSKHSHICPCKHTLAHK